MKPDKKFLKELFLYGFLLWIIGYALGMMLFAFVPIQYFAWIILPIGTAVTWYVTFKKLSKRKLSEYFFIGLTWLIIAASFDYLFLVKAFDVVNYYKWDIFVYYTLTFLFPIFKGIKKD